MSAAMAGAKVGPIGGTQRRHSGHELPPVESRQGECDVAPT